ncbi:MAG: hypothetical protein NWE89_00700 [Candidatus Bathyarchaeota archaeon]|nr:hypothetical protein [Candidatus Bathyarchaeota archaeon]
MGTSAASVLDERLSKILGDWLEVAVTTALTTSTSVVSTNLNEHDDANDDHFNTFWCYITDYVNAGADRKIYDYVTSGGTCSVRGADFTDEADKATVRISRHGYTAHLQAINDAIRELYPNLYRHLEDRTLVTGQMLPDNSFELWTSSTNPSLYSGSTDATLTRTTTAGYIRGPLGTTSMLVETGADDQYAYIDSDTFPRLLDLRGRTITFKCWARPTDDDEAFLTIAYEDEDGTETTTNSTTSCPKDVFTLLEIEGLAIPSDITKIEFRFRAHTNGQDAYFDSARVTGKLLQEYLLLSDFADGTVLQVYIQTESAQDAPCDDLHPARWARVYNWYTYSDGTYKWLRFPETYQDNRQIRVIGIAPLSTVTDFTDTVEIDGAKVDLLIAYAAYCLLRNEEDIPSAEDTGRYASRAQRYLMEYYRLLPSLRMLRPSGSLILPRY